MFNSDAYKWPINNLSLSIQATQFTSIFDSTTEITNSDEETFVENLEECFHVHGSGI